jgi:hypothetical protein
MNMRVRQLWAPVLSTFLVSVSVQFVALRVPQWPPWVFFTRNAISAGPMSYSVGSKQYVAVVAGNTLFAFGLRQ